MIHLIICLQLGVWLVMFCDEINLPDMDAYGTQRVISFLRQMVEHNGFYRSVDCQSAVLRSQIRDPLPFWPLVPGWVKKQVPDLG
jgi:hypothetical protein